MTFTGEKYNSEKYTDIKDIAKFVRGDLKKDFPKMKFSVRIERYSGGRSLNVTIKETTIPILHNPNRVKKTIEDGYNYYPASNEPAYLLPAEQLLKRVKDITDAYNYDESDMMTDYFSVNFYSHVGFAWELEKADKAKIEAMEAEEAERIYWDDQNVRDAILDANHERYLEEQKIALEKAEAETAREVEEAKANAPIAVKKVVFEWSESNLVTDGQEFDSLDAANGLLFQIACERTREDPNHGHYTKTKITIHWVNEESYTGRWDVNALDHGGVGLNGADCHIGMHITGYAKNVQLCHSRQSASERVLKDESPLTARMPETKAFFQAIVDGKYEV